MFQLSGFYCKLRKGVVQESREVGPGLGFYIWEFPKIGNPNIVPKIVGSLL